MMKKSYIYFVLILSNLFAQSFTGYIKDVSGEPVSFVIIEEINSNLEEKNWAISDENGVFTINVQSNSQLSFDRIGYKDNVIELSKIEGKSIVMLNKNISLEQVDVYGSNKDEYLKNSTSLNWDELQKISIEIEENYKDN